jgi:hypothetical protein
MCGDEEMDQKPLSVIEFWTYIYKKKGKAIPVTGREGPEDSGTLRFPHFL